jgi:hypothetical protein
MVVNVSGKRASSTSTGGSDATPGSAHALNLFDSGSSASDCETVVPALHQKRPQKSPALKKVPKPRAVKGNFKYFLLSAIAV